MASPLPGFWAIVQPKIEICAWIFVHWLLLYSSILYIPLLDLFKNFDSVGIYFRKIEILILGVKTQKMKTRDSHFVKRLNWHLFGVFCLRFASKPYILEAIESWPFFDPNLYGMMWLKRHFLKTKWTDFAQILCECSKLMMYKLP